MIQLRMFFEGKLEENIKKEMDETGEKTVPSFINRVLINYFKGAENNVK